VSEVAVGGRPRALADRTVHRIVAAVLRGERREAAVSVTFLGRLAMRRLNARHKRRDEPTDVIAFSLRGPGGTTVGDVYVCPWVARREAKARGIPVRQELVRLVVHGTLHVLGYDHPGGAGRESSPMWRRQERYVEALA
jgi:probable rRNA maturation factor